MTQSISTGFVTTQLLAAALAVIANGCGSVAPAEESGSQQQEIIGGYTATSPALNHTGMLVTVVDGAPRALCTATLIGESTVLTAKHCADVVLFGSELAFGVGADIESLLEIIPVVAVAFAPSDAGGFVGLGQDVAILHLEHAPISAVQPVVPRPSSELEIGRRMVTLGYGVFGAGGASDNRRRIGRETVSVKEGSAYGALLGDFESFVEWVITGSLTDEDWLEIMAGDPALELLLKEYEATPVLLDGDEAVTGHGARDTQSCYGDSGGPLLGYNRSEQRWETYGVVSGGLRSARSKCDFGTVFATFGPEVMAFIEAEQIWEDPCGEVTAAGDCTDNIASNCATDLALGLRELQQQDCSQSGQTCELFASGAGCGVAPPSDEAPSPPGVDFLKRHIVEGFRGANGIDTSKWSD